MCAVAVDESIMTTEPMVPAAIDLAGILPDDVLVDLRSPAEYASSHIPGAVSLPILDDSERHEVGLTYQLSGPEAARTLGVRLVSPRLPSMIERIASIGARSRVVLYCWRGGMRSRIFADLVQSLGHPVTRLTGGYRAHRRWVVKTLAGPFPPLIVVHGYTGSGKTRLLRRLIGEYPVVDLEDLARHRGSTFGHVGLGDQPGQKQFESALALAIQAAQAAAPSPETSLLVEGESPTIGKIHLPPALCHAMRQAPPVFVELPRDERVRLLLEDYGETIFENQGVIADSLSYLRSRQPRRLMDELAEDLAGGRHGEFCAKLLEHHYDPLYERAFRRRPDREVCPVIRASTLEEALQMLRSHLQKQSVRMHLALENRVL